MKVHYFDQDNADEDDILLKMAIKQGYVTKMCLLGGHTVMGLMNEAKNPCKGCKCDRLKCKSGID